MSMSGIVSRSIPLHIHLRSSQTSPRVFRSCFTSFKLDAQKPIFSEYKFEVFHGTQLSTPSRHGCQLRPITQIRALSNGDASSSFWVSNGATENQIRNIIKTLQTTPYLDKEMAESKIASLEAILPGVEVMQLVFEEPEVLLLEVSAVGHLVMDLIAVLPGCDISQVLSKCPRLVWYFIKEADISSRMQEVTSKVNEWAPSIDVVELVSNHPNLLLRVPDEYTYAFLRSIYPYE